MINEKVIKDHHKMLERLVKSPEVILEEMTVFKCALMHAVIGMVGEVIELCDYDSDENLIEEAGDFLFYDTDMRRVLGISLLRDTYKITIPAGFKPVTAVGQILDLTKKVVITNRELATEVVMEIHALSNQLHAFIEYQLVHVANVDREVAYKHNLNKLIGPNGRYPDGEYSDKLAAERRDKQDADLDEPLPERQSDDDESCDSCQ